LDEDRRIFPNFTPTCCEMNMEIVSGELDVIVWECKKCGREIQETENCLEVI
jgi:hypothetical protein